MNLPNRLTVTRLVLAPVFFFWFFTPEMFGMPAVPYAVVLVLLYAVMELTDLFDGRIARKRKLVTDLGKVMDPFGDVIAHLTFFTCLLSCSLMPVWAFMIILWREFSQSFMRMLLMGRGKPMAANIFGKAKTVLYAVFSVCGFAVRICGTAGVQKDWMGPVLTVCALLAALASAVSFIIYIRNIIKDGVLDSLSR